MKIWKPAPSWSTPTPTAAAGYLTSRSTLTPWRRASRSCWTPRPTAARWPNDPCYRSLRPATMHAGPGPNSDSDQMSASMRGGAAHWAPGGGTVVTSTVTAGGKPVDRTQPDNAAAVSKEQRVTDKDNDQTSDEVTVETTSVFRADFLNELDAPAQSGSETAVSGVEGLPVGSALLVVKRGPNAGSRFLLDQPTTSAGRHPDSDIFLDDVTVSRRHAEFRLETDEFQVVDVGSLNGTYVNREPVDSAVLANGDEVQIGKFRLVFLTGPKVGEDGGPGS